MISATKESGTGSQPRKIAFGADSEVFLVGEDKVLKRYPGWSTRPDKILLYKDVTDKAALFVHQTHPSAPLIIGREEFECVIEINPILEHSMGIGGVPEMKSQFIPGPRYDQIRDGKDLQGTWSGLPEEEQQFIAETNKKFAECLLGSERIGFCRFKPVFFIEELNVQLNRALDVRGIRLVPLNMKFRVQSKKARLIVTDLCPSIDRLERR